MQATATSCTPVSTTRPFPSELSDNSLTLLKARYLSNGESVDNLWDRVSDGNPRYRRLMSELLFLPNSPTLFNAGLNNGCTLAACFVFSISDCMIGDTWELRHDSILGTRLKAAAVAKAGGGVGYYGGNIRPKGSNIKTIQRKACGPVAVLKDMNSLSALITQGGKRALAQMFVLPCWHGDINEFIHCKDTDPQSLSSFNISVGWYRDWMERVGKDARESELWNEQCQSAWRQGCPGMFFPDTVNACNPNPHLGLMEAPNPCGETPNRTDEPCCLGSHALPRYFDPVTRDLDWGKLEDGVRDSLWFLDDILDRNVFPHPAITAASLLTRKLGMGVMGWADLLAMMHIHYDSQEALDLGDRLMSFMNQIAADTSVEIARKKGPYPGYSSDKTNGPCARNETRTSIAPTGTIYLIAGCNASGIEPHYSLEWTRKTGDGMLLTEKVDCDNLYEGFVPHTSHDIHWSWHVRHQAIFQKHTDLGVSKTINLPKSATVEDVSDAYHMMHDMGCKGGTIFRDGCREGGEQVLVNKEDPKVFNANAGMNQGAREKLIRELSHTGSSSSASRREPTPISFVHRPMPQERESRIIKFSVGGTELFLTVGFWPTSDGARSACPQVGEIFLNGNFGTTIAGLLNAFCITFSLSLQYGTPLRTLIKHHINTRFEPNGITDNPDVRTCTSIPDLVCRWLAARYIREEDRNGIEQIESGVFCPECSSQALYQGGCLVCSNTTCGWSRCG